MMATPPPPTKMQRVGDAPGEADTARTQPTAVGAPPSSAQAAPRAAATWYDRKTLKFPSRLPMEHTYLERKFFVRDCYGTYYKDVAKLLTRYNRTTEVVTVTGTAGIGKSIFCAYFLKRCSQEAIDKGVNLTIITVSFSRDSVMTEVVVWKGGKVMDSESADPVAMHALIRETKEKCERLKHKLVCLCDGPPKIHLKGVQSVVFTSPNEAWFRYIRKDPRVRPRVVMPLWSIEELEEAATKLRLVMETESDTQESSVFAVAADDACMEDAEDTCTEPDSSLFEDEVESAGSDSILKAAMVADQVAMRFKMFGGVARICLSTDTESVARHGEYIVSTINKFTDISAVYAIINQVKDRYHSICHFVPSEDRKGYDIAEPTTYVKRLLVECLSELTRAKRSKIISYLDSSSAAASFRGMVFEISVHDILHSGCTFTARQLGDGQNGSETFKCAQSISTVKGKTYCYFYEDYTESVLGIGGPYHVPIAKNFAAIDSFYYQANVFDLSMPPVFYLFQITVARTHPVSGAGLKDMLSKLNLLARVKKNLVKIALIFVTTDQNAQDFRRQKIQLDGLLEDGDGVRCIDNIGPVIEAALKEDSVNVRSIGELRAYLENKPAKDNVAKGVKVGRLRDLLAKHDKKQAELGVTDLKATLESIPQFVWGVPSRQLKALSSVPDTSFGSLDTSTEEFRYQRIEREELFAHVNAMAGADEHDPNNLLVLSPEMRTYYKGPVLDVPLVSMYPGEVDEMQNADERNKVEIFVEVFSEGCRELVFNRLERAIKTDNPLKMKTSVYVKNPQHFCTSLESRHEEIKAAWAKYRSKTSADC